MTAEAQVSSQPVLLDRLEAGVLTLTLNRPERLNALNAALLEALAAGIAARCRGARLPRGSRHGRRPSFCAGADLANRAFAPGEARPDLRQALEKRNQSADPCDPRSPEADRLCGQRPGCGGGANIALACDIVLAAKSAAISAGLRAHRPYSRCRRHLDPAASRRAKRGPAGSLMLAEPIGAEDAAAWGMIYARVDDRGF